MKSGLLAFFAVCSFNALVASTAHAEPLPWLQETQEEDFANDTATLTNEELDENRGMFVDNSFLVSQQLAYVTGNSVQGGMTGSNQIGEGAISGVNGIFTGVFNTGNNVIIQTSTILNVRFE